MTEPNTVNKQFIVPNTGDLPGAWGTAALNPDFVALDGILGGFATIALSAATTITLSVATGSITPSAGPTQSQNALLRFTGNLTGTATILFSMPGFYIVENLCSVGAFCLSLAPVSGTGNTIGAPPGEKCHVFYDGTSMDYVDLGRVGSALDLHGVTAPPSWIQACTVRPYLIKDGTIYSTSVYPALGAQLGSAFGGNGITTFAVPDELSRIRLPVDTGATGRVTVAISGINGTTMGAAGGSQSLQAHTHTATVADPGHAHGAVLTAAADIQNPGGFGNKLGVIGTSAVATTNITVTNVNTGAGNSQNMPPAIVSFLPLIKT